MSSYHLFKRIRNIRSAAKQMKPDALWVKQTRETLLMQVTNSQPVGSKSKKALSRSFSIFIPAVSFKWMRTPATIAMAIVIALFSGSLFSVSASERALPGDLLYSIKLVTEQARIALVKEPDEKVKLKTEFTKRRVDEIRQVIQSPLPDKSERVQRAAESLKRDMDTIKNQLEDVKNDSTPDEIKQTANLIDEQIASLMADLQDSKINLSAIEKIKLSEAQAAASDTSLKVIEVLLKTHFEDSEVVTKEELVDCLKRYNIIIRETISDSASLAHETEDNIPQSELTSAEIMDQSATSSSMVDDTDSNLYNSQEQDPNSKDEQVSDTIEGEQGEESNSSEDKLKDAMESFAEADRLADEQDLDQAVEMLKVGTQQAFAAQKTIEENAAKQEEAAKQSTESSEAQVENSESTTTQDGLTPNETQATGTDTGSESTSTEANSQTTTTNN